MKPKTKYSEKLLDPRWQKKRLEILQRDEWACQVCGDKKETLHVHHRAYFHNVDPWDVRDEYLVTLCCNCHEHESECMSEYITALTRVLKRKFFADDVFSIMNGFWDLKITKTPKHTADVLEYALSNEKVMSALSKMYAESTSVKAKQDA